MYEGEQSIVELHHRVYLYNDDMPLGALQKSILLNAIARVWSFRVAMGYGYTASHSGLQLVP
jgi:hypothetical protein